MSPLTGKTKDPNMFDIASIQYVAPEAQLNAH